MTQFCVSVCIRVSVTYISDDKKHNVIHVTSVTLCPLVARVTYVTQFCVSVTFSIPGHIRDPILCICVYLCPIVYRVTYVTQFCVPVCIRVSVTYISDDKEYNVAT